MFFLRFRLVLKLYHNGETALKSLKPSLLSCPYWWGGGEAFPHHDAATFMLHCGSVYFGISTFSSSLIFLPLHNYALQCEI